MGKLHIEHYRNGLGKKFTPVETDTQNIFRAVKLCQYLETVSAGFCETIEHMRKEKLLTPAGQRMTTRNIAIGYLNELTQKRAELLDPLVNGFNIAIGNVLGMTRALDPVQAVARMELRQHFAKMEMKDRIALFEKAVQDDDGRITHAFIENSDIFKLLPTDKLEAGKMQWITSKDPVLAQNYQQSRDVAPFCAYAFRKVAEDFTRYLPIKNEYFESLFKKLPANDLNYVENDGDKIISALPSDMPGMILEETTEIGENNNV